MMILPGWLATMNKQNDAKVMTYGDRVRRCQEAKDQHFVAAHMYSYRLTRIVGDRYRALLFARIPRKEAWERANDDLIRPKSLFGCSCRE